MSKISGSLGLWVLYGFRFFRVWGSFGFFRAWFFSGLVLCRLLGSLVFRGCLGFRVAILKSKLRVIAYWFLERKKGIEHIGAILGLYSYMPDFR